MDAKRQNGFIKNLIETETIDVANELKTIIENRKKDNDDNIKTFLQEIKTGEGAQTKPGYDNLIRGHDVFTILGMIFENKLDFHNRLNGKRNVLEQWQKNRSCKNEELSIKLRENGNDFLRKGDLKNALHFYNEAILFALPDGINFALILANRAVILAKMKELKWAIEDLSMSIETGKYPSESIHKLYSRLAKAYEHLQQFELAITSYKMQFDSMKASSSLTKSQKLQMKSDTEKSIASCKKYFTAQNFTAFEAAGPRPCSVDFPVYHQPHSQLHNASDALQVTHTPERGRFVVASRDIEVGECLIHEEAIVNLVRSKCSLSHCYNCQKNTRLRPVPCLRCAAVVFCSVQCRSKSEASHIYDCPLSLYDLYLQHGGFGKDDTYIMFLAYKSISQKPRQFFHNIATKKNYRGLKDPCLPEVLVEKIALEQDIPIHESDILRSTNASENNYDIVEEMNNEDDNHSILFKLNENNDSKMEATTDFDEFDGYDVYFNMVTHISHLSNYELFERIIKSVFLVNCLEATSFFRNDTNSDFELNQAEPNIEERVLFAGFLFQAYCTILTNVHSISELDFTDAQEDANSESYLGVTTAMTGYVLFPNVSSIVNHSCDPNTSCFYTNGKTQVSVASRCIAKGEEICQVYQGHFGDTTKESRQHILEHMFHFQCRCIACENNFPLASELPHTFSQMADQISNEDQAEAYLQEVKEKMGKFGFDAKPIKSINKFENILTDEIKSSKGKSWKENIVNIFKILDDYREHGNDEIRLMNRKGDMDAIFELQCDMQKIASIFLKPPHKMFLSGRAAITNSLWAKYGGISYGRSRAELS